jgi:hypothetical protein
MPGSMRLETMDMIQDRRMTAAAVGLLALVSLVLPACTPRTPITVGSEHHTADPFPVQMLVRPQTTSVTHGASVFVAVWQDSTSNQIWLSRFSEAGERLAPTALPLGLGTEPDVSFDGTNFLVVALGDGRIVATRVSPEGVVLDTSSIVVADDGLQNSVAVAFDGTNYFVVWTTFDIHGLTGDVFGRHVTPAGTVVEPADLTISATGFVQTGVALAFNGEQHLVVWNENLSGNWQVRGTLVDPAGTPSNPEGVPISDGTGAEFSPTVTDVGDEFFVAWSDGRGPSFDIYGTRVDETGAVTDPAGIRITTATGSEEVPAVSSDGSSVLVTWTPNRLGSVAPRFTLVDPSGTVLDPAGRALPGTGIATGLAFDGTNYFVAGDKGTRLSSTGTVLDPAGLALGTLANEQFTPDSSFDGTNTFVVWDDTRFFLDVDHRVFGARVGPNGERLDGSGIAISTNAGPAAARSDIDPAVAFDGTNHLVVWLEWSPTVRLLRGARVSRDGVVLNRFTINSEGAREPAVAFGGGTFLVTWVVDLPGAQSAVRAARVTPAGTVLDPSGVQLRAPAPDERVSAPAVVHGDDEFLVAWSDQRAGNSTTDLYGARISAAGVVANPGGTLISGAPQAQNTPDVAWQDGTYLVVWEDERDGAGLVDIYGARLDGDGNLLDADGIPLARGTTDQGRPSVAASGDFLVAWHDRPGDGTSGVHGSRVDTDGTVRGPDGLAISATPPGGSNPAVSPRSGNGTFAVAYDRSVAESPFGGKVRALVRNVAFN